VTNLVHTLRKTPKAPSFMGSISISFQRKETPHNTMNTYKDYSPIVASFIFQMLKGGWKISRVIDCCGQSLNLSDKSNSEAKKLAKNEVLGGDDSTIVFIKPNGRGKNMRIGALILLGNGADELVADWSSSSPQADQDFEIHWDKFCKIWEAKEVPTVTR